MAGPAIIETDADFRITRWDDAAAAIYGWSARETIGEPIWIIVPRHRADFVRSLWPRIRKGEPVGPYLGVHVRKDGTRVGVEIRLEPRRDDVGEVCGARGLVRAAERSPPPTI